MVEEQGTDSGRTQRTGLLSVLLGGRQKLRTTSIAKTGAESKEETGFIDGDSSEDRLWYIDNIRLFVIVCVVMHHLAVTYSGFGSWYYTAGDNLDTLATVWFAFYLSFQQAYFMGLLFMLAGYFVAASYDRKGFNQFVRGRFSRLVIPTLIYMVVITPFISVVELGDRPTSFDLFGFLSGTGVMWFAAALFLFSLVYAIVRRTIGGRVYVSTRRQFEPSLRNVGILILLIAGFAFLIRIFQPVGTNVLNMQLCYFASYIVLFLVGIVAYRTNLFARISYRAGTRWLLSGIVLGFLVWLFVVAAASKSPEGTTAIAGGLTWWSAAYSTWESFVAVAMGIGVIAVFRERFNHQPRIVETLSDNSFAVYMFHPPIIVAVTLVLAPLALPPIAKWLVLCIVCVPLCFAMTHFVFRRIPVLKNYI